MIVRLPIVAGILLSLLSVSLRAEVSVSVSNNLLTVNSGVVGIAGYHGCDVATAKQLAAYVFELQRFQTEEEAMLTGDNSCNQLKGQWSTIAKKKSQDARMDFPQLPRGKYRVVVLAGQAIGCTLTGEVGDLPKKSIVYHKSVSTPVLLGVKETEVTSKKASPSGKLKVFPSPVSEELTVELGDVDLVGDVQISVLDLVGKVVYTEKQTVVQPNPLHQWLLRVQQYPSGAYFIRVEDEAGQQYTEKVIIQHHN